MYGFNGKSLVKVAMAEDHVLVRETLAGFINSFDHFKVILQADDGKSFLEQLDLNNLPDLALIDLSMPGMNGYDTIATAKKLYPSIKIMVISTFNSEEAILRSIKMGAEGFYTKRDGCDNLKKALHEMMTLGYYFTDRIAINVVREMMKTGKLTIKNDFTDEELLFLKYVVTEKTYKEIALEMEIPLRHAEYLRNLLFERFGVLSRTGLAILALEKGLASYTSASSG